MKRLYEDLNQHIDHLRDIAATIEYGKVHILTGGNAMGKSMIRKLISVEDPEGNEVKCAQTSMEQRTTNNPEWGALSSAMQDLSWIATSMNTWGKVKQLISIDDRFVILDEPEVGVGREVLLGMIGKINDAVQDKKNRGVFKGMCIITHSEFVVRNIDHDVFINIEGMTEDKWLTRQITAVDPDEVDDFGGELMRAIEHRINENRKKREAQES